MMQYLSVSLLLVQVVALLLRSCHKVKGGSTGQLITEGLCGLPMLIHVMRVKFEYVDLLILIFIFSGDFPTSRNKLIDYGYVNQIRFHVIGF